MLKNNAKINLTLFMLMMQYKRNHHIVNEVRQCFRTVDNRKPYFSTWVSNLCRILDIYSAKPSAYL